MSTNGDCFEHLLLNIRPGRRHVLTSGLRNLIDHFVPFLPLERNHVRSCIIDELRRQDVSYVEEETISEILDELRWYPDDLRLYSKSGCKKISHKIAMFDLTG